MLIEEDSELPIEDDRTLTTPGLIHRIGEHVLLEIEGDVLELLGLAWNCR
jgi:hypothetical protein